jgi:hypothetical protein
MEELVRRLCADSDPVSPFVFMPPASPQWPDDYNERRVGAVQTFSSSATKTRPEPPRLGGVSQMRVEVGTCGGPAAGTAEMELLRTCNH